MKNSIFISYASTDIDKVDLIIKEFENSPYFTPLVVAFNREPNKALVKKVTEGILNSFAVVPILSQESIRTQWINQEIGYSEAKNKIIRPIVEHEILNDLKGFIHKQNDLPYTYRSQNLSTIQKEESFLSAFRILMSDLETDYTEKMNTETESKSGLTLLDEAKISEKIYKKQRQFHDSDEGRELTKTEFFNIYYHICKLKTEYRKRGIPIKTNIQTLDNPYKNRIPEVKITINGPRQIRMSLILHLRKSSFSCLSFHRWLGSKLVEPEDEEGNTYIFDKLEDQSFVWRGRAKNMSSSEIAEMSFNFLAKGIARLRYYI